MPKKHLEDKIDDLFAIADVRTEAREWREQGQKSLLQRLKDDRDSRAGDAGWVPASVEGTDFIQAGLIVLAMTKGPRRWTKDLSVLQCPEYSGHDDDVEALRPSLTKLHEFVPPDGKTAMNMANFQASVALQGLLRIPTAAVSKAGASSLYQVIKEIYWCGPPSWTVGSARATEAAVESAFVTAECVQAVDSYAAAMENTARIIQAVVDCMGRVRGLIDNVYVPKEWRYVEASRQLTQLYNDTSPHWRLSFIRECRIRPQVLRDEPVMRSLELLLWSLFKEMKEVLKEGELGYESALELVERRPAPVPPPSVVSNGHNTAREAVADGLALIREINEVLKVSIRMDREVDTLTAEELDLVEERVLEVVQLLFTHAQKLRGLTRPSIAYLSAVLDTQLAMADSGTGVVWSPAELAFSAAIVAEKDPSSVGLRVERAIGHLIDRMAPDGAFPPARPLEANHQGYRLNLSSAELTRALCQSFEISDEDLDPDVAKRLLQPFIRTRIESSGDLLAWTQDYPIQPPRAYRWSSAMSILALDRIARFLDFYLNKRVLEHFSVRKGRDLGPPLDKLFYPDFGFVAANARKIAGGRAEEHEIANYAAKNGVAITLERMRAHIDGRPLPGPSLHASMFYGPPGTGKTTLMESVARSCDVPLVEITPSDLVIQGEELVERRARIVFGALSLLTRVVIIFDEFDQILRDRGEDNERKADVFFFLTASMLPKLKLLNNRAKHNQFAFALTTNHAGWLDSAAIRPGRFDHHLPIFPPDVLSRAGRLASARHRFITKAENDGKNVSENLLKVVEKTRDAGMTRIAVPGEMTERRKPGSDWSKIERCLLAGEKACEDLTTGDFQDADPDREFGKLTAVPLDVTYINDWQQIRRWDDVKRANWDKEIIELGLEFDARYGKVTPTPKREKSVPSGKESPPKWS